VGRGGEPAAGGAVRRPPPAAPGRGVRARAAAWSCGAEGRAGLGCRGAPEEAGGAVVLEDNVRPEVAHLRGGDPSDATDEDRPATDSVGLSRRERPHCVASLESRGDAGGECRCGADESPRGDHRDPRPVLWRARRRTAPLRISILPAGAGSAGREVHRDVDARKHQIESRPALSDEKVPRGGRRHCGWRG